MERRRTARGAPGEKNAIHIGVRRSAAGLQALEGVVVDFSETGVGIETRTPLSVGDTVTLWGPYLGAANESKQHKPARVVHCRVDSGGSFRAGCIYEDQAGRQTQSQAAAHPPDHAFVDYYEVLQVSPNASLEAIQRVYRMLAQLYHPDNTDTGNSETFHLLMRAYQVLSDPERRAKYDIEYHSQRTKRWRIFDQTKALQGVEAEQRKRWGILSILYTKRMEDAERPGLQLREFENLLGCPREHLQFASWYLREQGLIRLEDSARYAITAKGVETAEKAGLWKPQELPPLLEEGDRELPDSE